MEFDAFLLSRIQFAANITFHIMFPTLTIALGLIVISLATPMMSERIFDKWFSFPEILSLLPIPVITGIFIIALYVLLKNMPFEKDRFSYLPLIITAGIFIFSFCGLAYSFFPYIVPDQMKIVDAAASPEALMIMLVGAFIVLPILIGYTVLTYAIFHGKAQNLRYD